MVMVIAWQRKEQRENGVSFTVLVHRAVSDDDRRGVRGSDDGDAGGRGVAAGYGHRVPRGHHGAAG